MFHFNLLQWLHVLMVVVLDILYKLLDKVLADQYIWAPHHNYSDDDDDPDPNNLLKEKAY